MSAPTSRTDKGTRGFELDLHVTFTRPLPEAQARAALLALPGFTVDLYRPHPNPTGQTPTHTPEEAPGVPSARLTGPLTDPDAIHAGLAALLGGDARSIEVGLRGFLRSAQGQTDWMPWRRNVVLPRADVARVTFEQSIRFVLE